MKPKPMKVLVYDPSKAIACFHQKKLEEKGIHLLCYDSFQKIDEDIASGRVNGETGAIMGNLDYFFNPVTGKLREDQYLEDRKRREGLIPLPLEKILAKLKEWQEKLHCQRVIIEHCSPFDGEGTFSGRFLVPNQLPYSRKEVIDQFNGEVFTLKRSYPFSALEAAISPRQSFIT